MPGLFDVKLEQKGKCLNGIYSRNTGKSEKNKSFAA